MELISIREFARRDGCDDKLVRRAIIAGHLALINNQLDAALVGSGWRLTNRRNSAPFSMSADKNINVRDDVSAPPKPTSKPAATPAGKASAKPIAVTVTDLPIGASVVGQDDLEGFITRLLGGQFATRAEAEAVKENALALKHILAARREAGSLVEIEDAEMVIFNALRAIRDAWLNWPVRIGPILAADLGIPSDRLTEVLTSYVHQQLADLGEPQADFRGR